MWCERLIRFVLKDESVGRAEVGILLVSSSFIRGLNKKFLSKDSPTDVLAFDISDRATRCGILVGDVVVSADAASAASKMHNIPFDEELRRYLIHGVLHLLGYNDLRDRDRRQLWRRQEELVKKTAQMRLEAR